MINKYALFRAKRKTTHECVIGIVTNMLGESM